MEQESTQCLFLRPHVPIFMQGLPERFAAVLLHIVFWSLTLIGRQVQLILSVDWRGDQVLQDLAVSLKWTHYLAPDQELTNLLGKFPQFLKVDVSVGQSAGTAFIEEVDVLDQQTEERDNNLVDRDIVHC